MQSHLESWHITEVNKILCKKKSVNYIVCTIKQKYVHSKSVIQIKLKLPANVGKYTEKSLVKPSSGC